MTYILDTNIFLRTLIIEDKEKFSECVQLLEMVKSNKIKAVVPGVVLTEIVWVLKSFYKFPKSKVVQAIGSISKLSGLKIIDSYDHQQALELFEKNKVKYIDCLIASLVKNKNFTIISYDLDFDKLQVKKVEPNKFSS